MPKTYVVTRNSALDVAREVLGQTETSTTQFDDVTITNAIANYGWYGGISHLARSLGIWYAQEAAKFSEQGGQSTEFQKRAELLLELADDAAAHKIQPAPGTTAAPVDTGFGSVAVGTVIVG